ncbi:helix-turn-helix transcriptional regulator [Streptomyces sp. N2-109]|uniref:Helix-turn-helix transcriptional regulator n=1 Tax=Streptomyces gossypii TaxID=2883101 RepID=A0ABT2JR30_9ACTN|nr:helix-turn-helix transcriptional regulator [Streptomyces gossypii]MCT2590332.1 helix-turn-helix transcriptional regulator [Streptomyces gossypii]
MYEERPARLGGGAVLWSLSGAVGATESRVLPDGCMDLIWSDGFLVAGPDTGPHVDAAAPGRSWTGLRFAPGTGPSVLGVPAHELRDRRVPLDALWPGAQVRRLTERAAESADPAALLEQLASPLLRPDPAHDAVRETVLRGVRQGSSVAELAQAAGLSTRQLHRRALDAFGYGPKTLARVLRMRRALVLARAGRPPAEVALAAGYADQPHLAREIKALTGLPLTQLLASR